MEENMPDIGGFRKKFRLSLFIGWAFIIIAVILAAVTAACFMPSKGYPAFQTGILFALSIFILLFGIFILALAKILRNNIDSLEDKLKEQQKLEHEFDPEE